MLLEEALAILERVLDARRSCAVGGASPAVERHLYIARPHEDPFPEIDGGSPEICRLKQHMLRVALDSDVTVLISGESGTGKERIARAIHRASPRRRLPFVVVNCAGLAPTLIEDELFGHVRGAFTGATEDRAGPFERASGGTVFLDEIGDLPPDLQMKLLRALQQRAVQRLGSRHETPFDARVIAATNVDLAAARARGRFREDLYYRLKVYELKAPPLRHRGPSDIRLLAGSILERLAGRRHRPTPALHSDVLDVLGHHRWPGNVRELENTLECMIVTAGREPTLTVEHLPDDFILQAGSGGSQPMSHAAPRSLPSAQDVQSALEKNAFRYERAADELGLSRHQLYRLRTRYDLRSPARGS